MPISWPSGPRHRMFGVIFASLKPSVCAIPAHGNKTEFPSGTTMSDGSILNLMAVNRKEKKNNKFSVEKLDFYQQINGFILCARIDSTIYVCCKGYIMFVGTIKFLSF